MPSRPWTSCLLLCLAAVLVAPPAHARIGNPPAKVKAEGGEGDKASDKPKDDEEGQKTEEAKPKLAERFTKGPIGITAKVVRKGVALPLFGVPVLHFQDRVEFAFAGEAFDTRVTQADWTLVVVFLPKTVAPTEKGVVSLALARTPEGMVAAPISVPYDSIPMVFLLPDSGGRRKILSDLNAHLPEFRNICLKLSDLAEQRTYVDRFLKGLEAIRQDQSAPAYDRAVLNFFKAYGGQVSQDLQIFLNRNTDSNLEKFQFIVSEFKRTNLLVPTPDSADRSMKLDGSTISGKLHPGSLYVAIAFDLIQVFQNLWPGHKFQYVPALAKDFDGNKAQLFYDDWIHTTGDVRGALVFSPCRWTDVEPPAFQVDLPATGSLLHPCTVLRVQTKPMGNTPFAVFGKGWQLALKGPKDEILDPIPLTPNPAQQGFVVEPGPALQKLQDKGFARIHYRVEGTWGFQSVVSPWKETVAGIDPTWKPSDEEAARFMVGQAASFKLPFPWGRVVAKTQFRLAGNPLSVLPGVVNPQPDGSAILNFPNTGDQPGRGSLELSVGEDLPPALSLPVFLHAPLPSVERATAHQGEATLLLIGHHLKHSQSLTLGSQVFTWTRETPEGSLFTAKEGTLAGEPGTPLEGTLNLTDGRSLPISHVVVMPPRPLLKDITVIPQAPHPGLAWAGNAPLVPVASTVLVSGMSGRAGRYPFGKAPKVILRNTDEPAAVTPVPAATVKLAGRGQRLLITLKPSELLGNRASGSLEWQVQDDAVGASAWTPLPTLFLELPSVMSLKKEDGNWTAEGQGLEQIEATATSPNGPWIPAKLSFRGSLQATPVAAPDEKGIVQVRLIGWPDQVFRLQSMLPLAPSESPNQTARH